MRMNAETALFLRRCYGGTGAMTEKVIEVERMQPANRTNLIPILESRNL